MWSTRNYLTRAAYAKLLARCTDNLDREVPPAKRQRQHKKNGDIVINHEQENNQEGAANRDQNMAENRDIEPRVIGKFLGCDVVSNEDQVVDQAQAMGLNDEDNVEEFDVIAVSIPRVEEASEAHQSAVMHTHDTSKEHLDTLVMEPIQIVNEFDAIQNVEEGEL